MKRRDFLGSLIAGATATLVPMELLSASTNPTVWNAATLTSMLEDMFACRVGPPSAFFEVTAAGKLLTPSDKLSADTPINRYTYETYVAATNGGTAEEAEAKLAKHFYEQFSKVPAGSLVWRTKPEFASTEITEFGKTWMTAEQIEDRIDLLQFQDEVTKEWIPAINGWPEQWQNKRQRKLPEAPIVIPEGVEYDITWGNYRYVTRKYTQHRIRMRLVLPEIYDVEVPSLPDLYKNEGFPIVANV